MVESSSPPNKPTQEITETTSVHSIAFGQLKIHSLSLTCPFIMLHSAMKGLATMATLAAGTNALVARGDTCCFGLEASGGASGSIGQLSDGQNRIGGGLPPGKFCLGTGGGLTDGQGRGCILTRETIG